MFERAARLYAEQTQRWDAAGLSNRQSAEIVGQLATKLAPMVVRGSILRPRLATSQGLLLIGKSCRISNPQFISFGGDVVIEDFAEIQGLSSRGLKFGRNVSIGSGAMIRPSSYYSREIGMGLVVGDNSSIGPQCYIGCSGFISIGRDVMIAPGVRLFAENHVFEWGTSIKDQATERAEITIEDGCWIASGATLTAGVLIGKDAVVAAGAVVTKDVPANCIVGGIPARVMGARK
jgi:acetyltransferase-like isoleucine patch superfamily enzyme